MNSLLITYELKDSKNDYSLISSKIKSYPWAKPMNSVWIIRTEKKPSEIRTELAETISNRGKILVVNITNSGWGSYALSKEVSEWMKEKL